ncbi:hypothetical protein, partial [Thalassolituus alkanivorans]|uniref:hypothetical protein n=1 Tax=Thalassolituus alkanivorans TaxID=2881055 RepID=UPI001E51AC8F
AGFFMSGFLPERSLAAAITSPADPRKIGQMLSFPCFLKNACVLYSFNFPVAGISVFSDPPVIKNKFISVIITAFYSSLRKGNADPPLQIPAAVCCIRSAITGF